MRATEHPGLGDALPETVEPLNPSSFPERLLPAGKDGVRGDPYGPQISLGWVRSSFPRARKVS